ncbi:MAG TPA: class I SAM-dependent methyltransferase [Bacillales bacterium]|nr:class I SAM-dependent methyltransferase [Bacillales bacterium]
MRKRGFYDPILFEGTANHYTYRPPYPEALFDYVVGSFGLNGKGRALDLGCGIGNLALPFAPYFEQVVCMDPDGEMLKAARQQAQRTSVDNLAFEQGSSWDLSVDMGTFRLVTMGESFHWMDRDELLRKLDDLVDGDGGLVIAWKKIKGPEGYQQVVDKVVRKFLGGKRRAGQGYYEHPQDPHETVLSCSPFAQTESWQAEYSLEWSINHIIGFLYSTSYANKRLLGDQVDNFEKTLREKLQEINDTGIFNFRIETEALLGRRADR